MNVFTSSIRRTSRDGKHVLVLKTAGVNGDMIEHTLLYHIDDEEYPIYRAVSNLLDYVESSDKIISRFYSRYY